jgi:hypothetical protein
MARKGWDSLSPNYRARLEKNGISKRAYDRGESIQSARGHENTPERPKQGAAFPIYQAERERLTRRIIDHKQFWFGTSPKYNPTRSARKFREQPPAMAQIRRWANYDREEWLDEIRENPAAAEYLGYH